MSQNSTTVTQDPVHLPGLTDGDNYRIQNRGPDIVFLAELAALPDRDTLPEAALELAPSKRPDEWVDIEVDATEPWAAWTAQGNAQLVISDVS